MTATRKEPEQIAASKEPEQIYMYLLALKPEFYYVGITNHPMRRTLQHLSHKGGEVTKGKHICKMLYLYKLPFGWDREMAEGFESAYTKLAQEKLGGLVSCGFYLVEDSRFSDHKTTKNI